MRISYRHGETIFLNVRAPLSGETFAIQLTPELQRNPQIITKTDGIGVNDTTSYSNLEAQAAQAAARAELAVAVARLKNPEGYGKSEGYTNLSAIEFGVGGSNPRISKAQKDAFNIG